MTPRNAVRRRPSPIACTVAVAVLSAVLLAGTARAQVGPTLQGDMATLVGQIGGATAAALAQNAAAAGADLADAQTMLAQIVALARDPGNAQELGALARRLGRKLGAVQRALNGAQAAVANPAAAPNRRVRALKVAYAKVTSVAALVGKPILVETKSRSAGFHHPGDVVTFRILGPDGGPCTETPTVVVQNQFGATAVDLASVHQEPDGTLAMTMGNEAGGASVTVTACGQSSTRLLFNDGPKTVPGLPVGFPAGLPQGTYQLSYSASGVVNIGDTPLVTLQNSDVHAFARALVMTFQQVANGFASPDCSIGTSYSPFDGNFFTATYAVTCTVDQASASESITFTVRHL